MDIGPFLSTEGSRPFQGTKECHDFDLWRKSGDENVYVLVRRFRMTAYPALKWVQDPPSQKVSVGFMVPIDHWDERVDTEGRPIRVPGT